MARSSGRVLFIAYDFPPCTSVGGSIRSEKFAKYLPGCDWRLTVLTLQETVHRNRPENFPDVCRIRSLTPWMRPYHVVPYGWAIMLYFAAKRMLNNIRHDIVYVSCPPYPQTLTALLLKLRYKIPLVVDFRDVWAQDPYIEGSRLIKRAVYKWIFPFLEKMVIRRSDSLIFNSESALQAYQKKYPDRADKMCVIPNGFDKEDFGAYKPTGSKDVLNVLYAGRFGVGDRNPEIIMQALAILNDEKAPIKFTFIGDSSPALPALVEKYGLAAVADIKNQIPHDELINMMGSFDVLLLYQENSPSRITPVAGKTYEYLRAGKPVLAVCPDGDNAKVIENYCAFYRVTNEYRPEKIAELLQEMIRDWKNNLLPVYTIAKNEFDIYYNRKHLALNLAAIFNDLCGRKV